jgi:hypothetical protein
MFSSLNRHRGDLDVVKDTGGGRQGRRRLASISESTSASNEQLSQHDVATETIVLEREDRSVSSLVIDSKIILYGDLQLLHSIFERYTSSILNREETTEYVPPSPHVVETEEPVTSDITAALHDVSISSDSSLPTAITGTSPKRWKYLSALLRSRTQGSTNSEDSLSNFRKGYGSIEVPNLSFIAILEALFRRGLVLVHVSSEYDDTNEILHQSFVFLDVSSNCTSTPQTPGSPLICNPSI